MPTINGLTEFTLTFQDIKDSLMSKNRIIPSRYGTHPTWGYRFLDTTHFVRYYTMGQYRDRARPVESEIISLPSGVITPKMVASEQVLANALDMMCTNELTIGDRNVGNPIVATRAPQNTNKFIVISEVNGTLHIKWILDITGSLRGFEKY